MTSYRDDDETQLINFGGDSGKLSDKPEVTRYESRTVVTVVIGVLVALVLMCAICAWAAVQLRVVA